MFRRILVANRGEVAARVMRTCRRMGIETVAIYSDADRDLSYLRDADATVHIGSHRSYLDQDAVLQAALDTRCSALHPGWGFLSENATFAARCEAARITFVGPRAITMRRMADKIQARATMRRLGVSPTPGSKGPLVDVGQAREEALRIGFPVLLKARSGGGGRGMRRVFAATQLADAFQQATTEAASAFGDGAVYLEKLVERARHVEFQVLGDGHDVVVLGARDCSVQRRHQKLIEETPVPGLEPEIARAVARRVQAACEALGYRGAGTIEMLADATMDINQASNGAGRLWFMEMNTRLQVEHAVTEQVTGIDIVEWQLRVAAHQRLSDVLSGGRYQPGRGHAIECRINAEDTANGFRPTPGRITRLVLPQGEGVRVDTHLREGDRVSPHYDSLLGKLITHGRDRSEAIRRMQQALRDLVVEGVPTTARSQRALVEHPEFVAGRYDVGQLERELQTDASKVAL